MKRNLFLIISMVLISTAFILVSCEEERKDPPLIQNVKYSGKNQGPFTVEARILDDNGPLKSAEVMYRNSSETTFHSVQMTRGSDDEYSGVIPSQPANEKVFYYIKAVNSADLVSVEPKDAPTVTLQFEIGGVDYTGLVLNEIWAGGPSDNHKFIELFNTTNAPIDISGVYFERNAEGVIGTVPANTILAAGGYYILGTKNNTSNPENDAAPYDNSVSKGFSAKKSILFLVMSPLGNEIDRFLRGDAENLDVNISDVAPKSYCRIPNGTGAWKAVDNATLRAANDATGASDIPND